MSSTAICKTCGGSPGNHRPSMLDPTGIGDPGHRVVEYERPPQPQSPPAGEELLKVIQNSLPFPVTPVELGLMINNLSVYILAQVKDLVGEDIPIFVNGKQVNNGDPMEIDLSGGVESPRFRESCKNIQDNGKNIVKHEILAAAQARFGAEEGKT